jgi:hypothetical protein
VKASRIKPLEPSRSFNPYLTMPSLNGRRTVDILSQNYAGKDIRVSRSMTALLAFCCLSLLSTSAFASSVGLNSGRLESGQNSARSRLDISAVLNGIKTAPVSGLRFGSAIVSSGARNDTLITLRSGVREFRFSLSTQCVVDPPHGSPSVVPEPSSVLLFGLGLMTLAAFALRNSKSKGLQH